MATVHNFFREKTSLQKAVDWVKNNRVRSGGIAVHHRTKEVSQEVTGYLVDSLYRVGEKKLALDLARWEASVQRPDGGFVASGTQVPYTFDTAQVLRGFLAVAPDWPEVEIPIRRAGDFLVSQIDDQGKIHTPDLNAWALPGGGQFSEYCNLYCLFPLKQAGQEYNIAQCGQAVERSLKYFKSKPDLVEFKPQLGTLSHIFGYMLEALAELGETELARQGLAQAEKIWKPDGSVPAYPGAGWVCSTGLAQLGIAWYKTGRPERAKKVLEYLEKIQNPSGGWFSSYGPGAQYFPNEEISWANKYFIDLHLLVRETHG